jgi:hypothetical protein
VDGASIGAVNHKRPFAFSGVFRWVDTPWGVAAVLGIWGVMIGIEEFLLANIAASTAAILIAVKLARETLIWTRRRHTAPFVIGMLSVIVLLSLDFWWTGHQKASSETKNAELAQLGRIPGLEGTITQMTHDEQEAAKTQAAQQSALQQQVKDIGADNKSLKTSIERKDATLAKIASDQFALNFTPQVTTQTDDSPAQVKLVNLGKTNIQIQEMKCNSQLEPHTLTQVGIPDAAIAPNSFVSMQTDDSLKLYLSRVSTTDADGKVPFDCTVSVTTQDKRRYSLPFTWIFVVKDGSTSRSYAVSHAIIEVRE